MKKAILLLLLCMGVLHTHAQQYFNKRNTLHSGSSILESVFEGNHQYYVLGNCLDSSNDLGNGFFSGITGIKFAIFDERGNRTMDTVWKMSQRNMGFWNRTVTRMPNGHFILAADNIDTNEYTHLFIIALDTLGRHLWDREYDIPFCSMDSNRFLRLTSFKQTPTGEWLMLCTLQCNGDADADMVLTKLDSGFNIIWQKRYGTPANHDYQGRLLVENDGYIIGCDEDNSNRTYSNYSYYAKMIKTDTAGNELWTWRSSNAYKTHGMNDLIRTRDGGYAYCGGGMGYEKANISSRNDIYFRGWVEKIDANRNPVWLHTFDTSSYGSEFNVIHEAANGNFVLFGNNYKADIRSPTDFDLHDRGWFMTLNANGDSLSQRIYSGITSSMDHNYFNDAKPTADGGFIMVGESTDQSPTRQAPIQRGWIVKVDSNGCVGAADPQCWAVGIEQPHLTNETKVYPNPVTSQLMISYESSTAKGALFQLTDVMGKLLMTQVLTGKNGTQALDVSSLANGLYLYRILEGKTTTRQGKIIKQ